MQKGLDQGEDRSVGLLSKEGRKGFTRFEGATSIPNLSIADDSSFAER